MKIVVAPDSFKGTLSAEKVTEIVGKKLLERYNNIEIIQVPLGDGGEGTADCIRRAIGGRCLEKQVTSPFIGEKTLAKIVITDAGDGIIESAEAMGLPLAGERKNPMVTTTYGVGEMIKLALDEGVRRIVLTLGGSSTNDGGAGMAVALGAKAYDASGREFIPTGGTLKDVQDMDLSGLDKRLKDVEVLALCDVKNPLCGQKGASYIYAPQKGASPMDVIELDRGLERFGKTVEEKVGLFGLSNAEGSGAAGGLGFGVPAFLGGKLQSGIDTIFKMIDFEKTVKDADLIITGEGKFDSQSLMGKVVGGVTNIAQKYQKSVAIVTGCADIDAIPSGIKAVIVTNPQRLPMSEVMEKAESMLEEALDKSVALDTIISNL